MSKFKIKTAHSFAWPDSFHRAIKPQQAKMVLWGLQFMLMISPGSNDDVLLFSRVSKQFREATNKHTFPMMFIGLLRDLFSQFLLLDLIISIPRSIFTRS